MPGLLIALPDLLGARDDDPPRKDDPPVEREEEPPPTDLLWAWRSGRVRQNPMAANTRSILIGCMPNPPKRGEGMVYSSISNYNTTLGGFDRPRSTGRRTRGYMNVTS